MNAVFLVLGVAACYTFTSLSDKHAISKAKFTGNEFTFLMCSSMAVLLLFTLPFQELRFTLTWQSFAAVGAVCLCKLLEFQMSARVLKQLTAFELKAWLGTTLFASYITDVFYGTPLRILSLLCIGMTAVGLIFIAGAGRKNEVDYSKIALPLVLYLGSKYGYGLVIKLFTPYVSPTLQLFPAFVILAMGMLLVIKPRQLIQKDKRESWRVILARIPNTAGMLLENAVIGISLSAYSFIQPMILVALFIIGLLRRERLTPAGLLGSLLCVSGVILFQL